MELVYIDFLTIESKTSVKDVNILVATDHLLGMLKPMLHLRRQLLWWQILCGKDILFTMYGFPEKILSDQGRKYESNLISELCKLTQVKK